MSLFTRQLDNLLAELQPIGEQAVQWFQDAGEALLDPRPEVVDALTTRAPEFYEQCAQYEERCMATLALHQPVSHDLRRVIAVLKIKQDFIRVAELAFGLAGHARALSTKPPCPAPYDLPVMIDTVGKMLTMAKQAIREWNHDLALEVRRLDDTVDDIHRGMYAAVASAIEADPTQVSQLVHWQNVSRQLERTADFATSMAKDVMYLSDGPGVRHSNTSVS